MSNDVDRILQAVPIESYIQKYVKLKRKGKNLWGLCPFHGEKTPSFSVAPEKGIYKCFGCGRGGNLFTFVQDYERLDFKEALHHLADYSGITLQKVSSGKSKEQSSHIEKLFKLNSLVSNQFVAKLKNSKAEQYLEKRQISLEIAQKFNLGYVPSDPPFLKSVLFHSGPNPSLEKALVELGLWGENEYGSYERFRDRLMIPILDIKGRVAGFGGRLLEEDQQAAKYMNSPESVIYQKKNLLYNMHQAKEAIRKSGQAVLVEGYLDVIGLVEKEISNVVAPLGTAFTVEQGRLLKRYTDHVVLFFDSDNAGRAAALKSLPVLRSCGLSSKIITNTTDEKVDPFDLTRTLSSEDLLLLMDNARDELSFVLHYFFSNLDNASLATKRESIEKFFEFITLLPDSWEQHEYLKSAAKVLNIPVENLQKDFLKKDSASSSAQKETPAFVGGIEEELTRVERELLAILLQFYNLWQEEALISRFKWKTQSGYLLYSFFKDRESRGEVFPLEQLRDLFQQLPHELTGPAATVADSADEFIKSEVTEAKAKNIIQRLVAVSNIEELEAEIKSKQELLRKSEQIDETSEIEELTVEIAVLIKEKKKFQESLETIRHNIYTS